MRTNKLHILATAAALLVAASAPSLAASRTQRGLDAYASGTVSADRSGAYYYGPQGAQNRAPAAETPVNRGQSQPFSDRAYGSPDNW